MGPQHPGKWLVAQARTPRSFCEPGVRRYTVEHIECTCARVLCPVSSTQMGHNRVSLPRENRRPRWCAEEEAVPIADHGSSS